ncbi:RNA-metabolising metallo-beta-lactamase [Patellaria atrata CBS 101060]|uniref:Cleavage and polyadenylation specificity factor subunit 2 n=1 Tax=Patellaria atrata CBS 101060 TaxID=1346257 RepID=A0A9P4S3X2_9PEZI|nr:RNA-metabolising metallo-beta-lactamase [Patellaria atrata CBS 101060]
MFNFTPLLGAQSSSLASQSLLELDGGIKILVDVGWDGSFDVAALKELEKNVPTLSVILLTHPTLNHLGAYAHCCKHIPLFKRIPVYATTPVISLGRTLLDDIYASTPLAATVIPESTLSETTYSFRGNSGESSNFLLQLPTREEIAEYFSLIHPLQYSQPHQPLASPFSPPLNGLTITAYNAGHTLGGTIWHILHGLESIVYAVEWNQVTEHVISKAAWLDGVGSGGAEVIEQLQRPTAFVCSSRGAQRISPTGGRRTRDDQLLRMIKETISAGGSVLIPSDSSARVLELAYLLDETWQNDNTSINGSRSLKDIRLYFASRSSGATIKSARSMLEWMEESLLKRLQELDSIHNVQEHKRSRSQQQNTNQDLPNKESPRVPFDFKHLKLLDRKSKVDRALTSPEPFVMLASDITLEWGFSNRALRKLALDPRNAIILTERGGQTSASNYGIDRQLWDVWHQKNSSTKTSDTGRPDYSVVGGEGIDVQVKSVQTASLIGEELSVYQQYLAQQRQRQNAFQTDNSISLETSADVVDDNTSTSSSDTEDSDVEHQGKALITSNVLTHARNKLGRSDAELGVKILLSGKGVHDFDVRGKKGREKSFPYVSKRRRGDDFGDSIRPEEYLRAEERDELDGEDMRNGAAKSQNSVGQKRKWDEITKKGGSSSRRPPNGRRRASDNATQLQNGSTSNVSEDGHSDNEEIDEESESELITPDQGPLKALVSHDSIKIYCKVGYVDFSGLHDKRSLLMLIPLIRPRKMIIVAGDEQETLALADECRNLSTSGSGDSGGLKMDVFTPTLGRTVDASVDTNAWTVKLSRSLVRSLHWQNVRGLGVVAVTGQLETLLPEDITHEDGIQKKKLKMINGEDQAEQTTDDATLEPSGLAAVLDVVPTSMAAATRSVAQPLHVGDLRLADLRKLMQASGFTAEFRGEGILLINSTVAVRKSGTGKIEVEGATKGLADGTFYSVKRRIYDALAVVTGA